MDFYENPLIPILAELNNLYSNKGKKLPSKIIDTIGKSYHTCKKIYDIIYNFKCFIST